MSATYHSPAFSQLCCKLVVPPGGTNSAVEGGIMINAIELGNVRIFEGSGWVFELHPLTVLCGVNSAGKSTLLKSLLLLRQSQQAGRLRIGGSQVDFGDYRSFVSHRDISLDATVGVTTDFAMSASSIDFLRPARQRRIKRPRVGSKESVVSRSVRLRAAFVLGSVAHKTVKGQSKRTESAQVSAVLKRADFGLSADGEELLAWRLESDESPKYQEAKHSILIPEAYFKRVGGYGLMKPEVRDGWVNVPTILDGLIPQWLIATPKTSRSGKRKAAPEFEPESWNFPLPPTISQALWSLTDTLGSISYLGPLRSPAKRYYVADIETTDTTDATGEALPYILRDRPNVMVTNIAPGGPRESQSQTLSDALNGWLFYLRTGLIPEKGSGEPEVSLDTTKQVLVQINIRGPVGTGAYAIADSGFGYSQVLPILVRGLLAPVSSTFIVEQPELHLNPSLQVRLAEFFVAMVRAGKQVILETHSEHVVNAIRVLAAEDLSKLNEKCRIYFLDHGPERPILHELSIRSDGTVPDWPRQFFGEAISLTGRLLRAQKAAKAPGEGQ